MHMKKLTTDENKVKKMFEGMNEDEKNRNIQLLKEHGHIINNEYELIVAYMKELLIFK